MDIDEKIQGRRHQSCNYLPIHPSRCLVEGTPALYLSGSQRFQRNSWVHIGSAYQCPTIWLEKVWDTYWHDPSEEGRLSDQALKTLVKYALTRGCVPHTYSQLKRITMKREVKRQTRPLVVQQPLYITAERTPISTTRHTLPQSNTADYGTLYQSYPRIFIDPRPAASTNPYAHTPRAQPREPWITRERCRQHCRILGKIVLFLLRVAVVLIPLIAIVAGLRWLCLSIISLFHVICTNTLALWHQIKDWLDAMKKGWESLVRLRLTL